MCFYILFCAVFLLSQSWCYYQLFLLFSSCQIYCSRTIAGVPQPMCRKVNFVKNNQKLNPKFSHFVIEKPSLYILRLHPALSVFRHCKYRSSSPPRWERFSFRQSTKIKDRIEPFQHLKKNHFQIPYNFKT